MSDMLPKNSPPFTKPFTNQKVFDDPTPNAVIFNRIVRHFFELTVVTDFTAEEREQFLKLVLLVGRKMASTWKHLDRYRKLQAEKIAAVPTLPRSGDTVEWESSQDLMDEADEFHVQLKSTLDHLIKIGVPIFGKHRWKLRTFGDNGNDVIKVLQRNVPKANQAITATLVENVLERHKGWLTRAIKYRDNFNHLLDDPISIEAFSVYQSETQGETRTHIPHLDGEPVDALMEDMWGNLVWLVEDFMALMLLMRIQRVHWIYRLDDINENVPDSPWVAGMNPQLSKTFTKYLESENEKDQSE